jgi:ectoine hydroxylase-related dioxygenase (phytanoyl-CoA dioxygenase family)
VPLVDFTVETGATQVWPGTHLDNRSYPDGVNNYDEWAAATPSALTTIPVGSLVLRDMRMWHRGMPNRTETIRTMLAVVYNRLFYDFKRKLDIPGPVWQQMSKEAQEVFRYNSIISSGA